MSKESEIKCPVHWQDNKIQGKKLQPVEENRPAYKCNLLDFMDILWRLWVFFALRLRFNCSVAGRPKKNNTVTLKEQ